VIKYHQSNLQGGVPLNQNFYILSLALVTLAVLVNRGNGNRTHQAVQLYLMALVLFCTLVAFGGL
jgi:hypothetical protein